MIDILFFFLIGTFGLILGISNFKMFLFFAIKKPNFRYGETVFSKWVPCIIDLLVSLSGFALMGILYWGILTTLYGVSMNFWEWSEMYPSSLPAFNQYELGVLIDESS